jgi:hypothetical protein
MRQELELPGPRAGACAVALVLSLGAAAFAPAKNLGELGTARFGVSRRKTATLAAQPTEERNASC